MFNLERRIAAFLDGTTDTLTPAGSPPPIPADEAESVARRVREIDWLSVLRRRARSVRKRLAAPPEAGQQPDSGAPGVTVPAGRRWGERGTPSRAVWLARHWRPAALAGGVAIALLLVVMLLPGPRGIEVAMASDSVADHPESALRIPPERITHAGEEFVLRPKVPVLFQASHPTPREGQWLIHIATSARLVASAGRTEKITYTLQQLDANWENGPTRREFLVLVTSNKVPPGWPVGGTEQVDLGDLFTAGTIAKLQDAADEPDIAERNREWLRELRAVLDRPFGHDQYGLRVYAYKSENK